MVPITPTTFLNSPLPATVVLEANLWFRLTRPSHCPPGHHRLPFPGPLFIVRPKWPASLNSHPVLALGTFCLHRLIYSFRTLTQHIPALVLVSFGLHYHPSQFLSSVQFSSMSRWYLCTWKNPHNMRSIPSLRSFPSTAFQNSSNDPTAMFIWLTMAVSRPFKEGCLVLPLSTPLSSRWLTVWCHWLCAHR